MPDYTLSQIKNMQDEATRRVQEMNRRNRRGGADEKQTDRHHEQNANHRGGQSAEKKSEKHSQKENKPFSDIGSLFGFGKSGDSPIGLSFLRNFDIKSLLKNADQSLILVIILLLSGGEETDHLLLMALLYILL